MADYRISGEGVHHRPTGAFIPNDPDNRDWEAYQAWLTEGNTPDPEYTAEEQNQLNDSMEIDELKASLRTALAWQFRMLLELFEVGKTKGLWVNTDFDATLRQKAADWKTKLDRLTELGE